MPVIVFCVFFCIVLIGDNNHLQKEANNLLEMGKIVDNMLDFLNESLPSNELEYLSNWWHSNKPNCNDDTISNNGSLYNLCVDDEKTQIPEQYLNNIINIHENNQKINKESISDAATHFNNNTNDQTKYRIDQWTHEEKLHIQDWWKNRFKRQYENGITQKKIASDIHKRFLQLGYERSEGAIYSMVNRLAIHGVI